MATKREGVSCYDRAGMDEPIFVLRAQDRLAAGVVRQWADLASLGGTKQEIVAEARKVADQMEAWPFHKHPGTSIERHSNLAASGEREVSLANEQERYVLLKHGFEALWTVCSHLETLILGRTDVPPVFHANLIEGFRVLRYSKETSAPLANGAFDARALAAEWRDDAKLILESCEIPAETTPWKPCEGCEWHAKGLQQAADELEIAWKVAAGKAASGAQRHVKALRDKWIAGENSELHELGCNCMACSLSRAIAADIKLAAPATAGGEK